MNCVCDMRACMRSGSGAAAPVAVLPAPPLVRSAASRPRSARQRATPQIQHPAPSARSAQHLTIMPSAALAITETAEQTNVARKNIEQKNHPPASNYSHAHTRIHSHAHTHTKAPLEARHITVRHSSPTAAPRASRDLCAQARSFARGDEAVTDHARTGAHQSPERALETTSRQRVHTARARKASSGGRYERHSEILHAHAGAVDARQKKTRVRAASYQSWIAQRWAPSCLWRASGASARTHELTRRHMNSHAGT